MLSAALTAHKQGGEAKETAPDQTRAPLELLQNAAFPCLRHAKGEVVEAATAEPSSGYEVTDLSKFNLAGTAPSEGLPDSVADYELNPFKRRGGEEVVGGSFAGVGSLRSCAASLQNNLISGQVIGSLPAGLTLEERKSIIQNTPMSPSLSMLSEMGLNKAALPTADAKQMRRTALQGAVLIFITAGYSGKRFIFQRCKDLGVRSVIMDGPESWSQQLVKDGLAEEFIGIDFSDADTLFDRLLVACKQVRKKLGDVDGLTTFCELAVPLVSRLAERLGLPCNTPEAVDTARNKHAARACMAEAGLPTPRNILIESADDLQAAADTVRFPAVLKPISGAASIGVVRVNNMDELKTSYARVIAGLRSARVVAGALMEGNDEDAGNGNAGQWMSLSIMMEEYLDGPEVDVDLVFTKGSPVYGAITDNWPTVEPWFNETGSNCPSVLSRAQQLELLDLGIKSVQCMGFEMGVFHVELKYTARGARLIEVNARMGGGPVRDTNLLIWGVDLVEQHVTASCGIPCRPVVSAKPLIEMAECTLNAKVTGTVEHTNFMDKYAGVEDVLYARPLVKPGDKVVGAQDGMPTWIAEMMVKRSPVEAAVEWIQRIEAEINPTVPIQPRQ